MLDRRDIARLFMTHYSDRAWDDVSAERARVRREVTDTGVCGYCVFGGDVEGARAFNDEMREAAVRPLLVASDLEQGLGQQMSGGTVFPSQMAIAAATPGYCHGLESAVPGQPAGLSGDRSWDDERRATGALANAVARVVGAEAAAVGVNVVFTPVADLATDPANPIIGVRSYGASPNQAAAMVAAAVSGFQSEGVAATAKHFPGHGDTSVDSHIDLPVLRVDRETLERRELVPFRAAVDAGVRLVMIGHLAFPALTGDEMPATLAPEVIEGLLRENLGFDGVVITDAMLMGGVAKRFGPAEASVMAVLAGADVLLMPEDMESAISGVVDAVGSGRISRERVERSLARIDELLSWLKPEGTRPSDEKLVLGSDAASEHARLAEEVAAGAVTLVSEQPGRLPGAAALASGEVVLAALVDSERPPDLGELRAWADSLPCGPSLHVVSEQTSAGELDRIAALASKSGAFVLFVFDHPSAWKGRTGFGCGLESRFRRALEQSERSAAVIFAGPRLVDSFTTAGRLLCCYDGSPPMQRAAARALSGMGRPSGVMPAPRGR